MTAPEPTADRTRLIARDRTVLHDRPRDRRRARIDMKVLLDRFETDPMWAWVLGAMLLMGGCIVIALHQHWRSAAAVIVSLFGWFLAIRGVLLLSVPGAYDTAANTLTGPSTYTAVLGVFAIVALAGLYLTYVGWIAPHRHAQTTSTLT
jgi:hypothetical protein